MMHVTVPDEEFHATFSSRSGTRRVDWEWLITAASWRHSGIFKPIWSSSMKWLFVRPNPALLRQQPESTWRRAMWLALASFSRFCAMCYVQGGPIPAKYPIPVMRFTIPDISKLGGYYIRLFLFRYIIHIKTLLKHIKTLLYQLIFKEFLN